jgi:hypothetical protein
VRVHEFDRVSGIVCTRDKLEEFVSERAMSSTLAARIK